LEPLLVEAPCGFSTGGGGCEMIADPDQSAVFVGSPGGPLPVTLRVRGVAELQPYDFAAGGSGNYRVDGEAQNPDWTILRLTISDPASTYHLNAAETFENRCFALDYTINTTITPGATVTLHVDDGDGFGWQNLDERGAPVSTTPPLPVSQPYDGQFIYVTLD